MPDESKLRDVLLSPGVVLVVGVVLSALLIPTVGWFGLAPIVLSALAVVVWMHALVAAVENQWNELRAVGSPPSSDDRSRVCPTPAPCFSLLA